MSQIDDIDFILSSIWENLEKTYIFECANFPEMETKAIIERIDRVFDEHRIRRAVEMTVRLRK